VSVALLWILFVGNPEVRLVRVLEKLLSVLIGECVEGHWPLLS
jgi:hypothetical protein